MQVSKVRDLWPFQSRMFDTVIIFLRVNTFLSAESDRLFAGNKVSLTDVHFSNELLLMAEMTHRDGTSERLYLNILSDTFSHTDRVSHPVRDVCE